MLRQAPAARGCRSYRPAAAGEAEQRGGASSAPLRAPRRDTQRGAVAEGRGGLLKDVTSELVRRTTLVNGACDSIKYWDAGLLRLGEKVKVIEEGKEINIDSQ